MRRAPIPLAVSGLFSEVLLLDADMHRAEGEAADIAHGAALRRPCRVHAGGYADFADCGLVILAAGTDRRSAPARLREALLGRNRAILQSILEQLTAVNRDAVLLVVSNPVDVLTGYTLRSCLGFPAERVIGSEPCSTRRASSAFWGKTRRGQPKCARLHAGRARRQ